MFKIENIKIDNYRSYYKQYLIPVKNGNNLLIYGENGSGKSSLYEGLKNFFLAADKSEDAKIIRHFKVDERGVAESGEEAPLNKVGIKVDFKNFENSTTIQKEFGNLNIIS